MLTELDLPYVDTSAAALLWSATEPDLPSLDVLHLRSGSLSLELRLLGSSHCAVLTGGRSGGSNVAGASLVETVACRQDDDGRPVPASLERTVGALRYRFASSVTRLEAPGLGALADRLRTDVRGRKDRLAGMFPGSPDALTVLGGALRDDGAAWETWHLYPNTGEAVRTVTEVTW